MGLPLLIFKECNGQACGYAFRHIIIQLFAGAGDIATRYVLIFSNPVGKSTNILHKHPSLLSFTVWQFKGLREIAWMKAGAHERRSGQLIVHVLLIFNTYLHLTSIYGRYMNTS